MAQPVYEEETRYEYEEDNRSLRTLISDLSRQLTLLLQKEMELARLEMNQKAAAAIKSALLLGLGGAFLYAGFLALLAAAAYGLAEWMPLWAGTLIVAAAVLIIGGILLLVGFILLRKLDVKPTRTILALKENRKWLRRQK